MILLIIVLFVFGLFAILLEAVLPFGISAAIGLLALGVSGWVAVNEYGMGLGLLYCILALVTAAVVARYAVKFGLKHMNLKPPETRIPGLHSALGMPQKEAKLPSFGETALVIQPLRPTGTIEWQGERLAARTLTPEHETPIGGRVVIRDRESIYWLVENAPEPPPDKSRPEAASEPAG